jgi:DNA-binding NarL/FixJ family response regulator
MADGGTDRVRQVLVVDDEDDLRTLVRVTLEYEEDMEVVATASTPAEALELADRTAPDLVILDQLLGGPVTGLQVADRLHAAHPETRVILFSAAQDVIDLREHDGVDAVLAKMDIGELPAVIRRVLHLTA